MEKKKESRGQKLSYITVFKLLNSDLPIGAEREKKGKKISEWKVLTKDIDWQKDIQEINPVSVSVPQ